MSTWKGFHQRAEREAEKHEAKTILLSGALDLLQYNIDNAKSLEESNEAIQKKIDFCNRHNLTVTI